MQHDTELPISEPWLSSRTAGTHLKLHYKTLERYARSGKLPGYFCFNKWLFLKSELDAFVKGTLHCKSANPCRVTGEEN